MKNNHKPYNKQRKQFFCPLGYSILWHRGLEYKECPLNPSNRDMPECKDCKLRVDKNWENSKETWKDKPVKKKKKFRNRRNKKQGEKK